MNSRSRWSSSVGKSKTEGHCRPVECGEGERHSQFFCIVLRARRNANELILSSMDAGRAIPAIGILPDN